MWKNERWMCFIMFRNSTVIFYISTLLIFSSSPSRPALLIHLRFVASAVLPPSSFPSSFPPLPPPPWLSGYHTSLIQTSWGFFHQVNYRQLGTQRITFSEQGRLKQEESGQYFGTPRSGSMRGCLWAFTCVSFRGVRCMYMYTSW